ncbi:hypothetical protein ABK040_005811 [Willaertia magna]
MKPNINFHDIDDEDSTEEWKPKEKQREKTSNKRTKPINTEESVQVVSINDQFSVLSNNKLNIPKETNSPKFLRKREDKRDIKKGSKSSLTLSDDELKPLKTHRKKLEDKNKGNEIRDSLSSVAEKPDTDITNESINVEESKELSLHLLPNIKRKIQDVRDSTNSSQSLSDNKNLKSGRIAQFITRFRNAPPTKRSDRTDVLKEKNSITDYNKKSNWKEKLNKSIENEHNSSSQNIRKLQESLEKEKKDVLDSIDEYNKFIREKRISDLESLDKFDESFTQPEIHKSISLVDSFDVGIKELNEYTELALERAIINKGSYESLNNKMDNSVTTASTTSSLSSSEEDDRIAQERLRDMFKRIGLPESLYELDSLYKPLSIDEEQQVEQLVSRNEPKNSSNLLLESLRKEFSSNAGTDTFEHTPTIENIQSPIVLDSVELFKPTKENVNSVSLSLNEEKLSELLGKIRNQSSKSEEFEVVKISSLEVKENNSEKKLEIDPIIDNNQQIMQMDTSFVQSTENIKENHDNAPFNEGKPLHVNDSNNIKDLGSIDSSSSTITQQNKSDISYKESQKMIEQFMKNSEEEFKINIDDDDNELFTNDIICQVLRKKIGLIKSKLAELQK